MSKCERCGSKLVPLFSSLVCPVDCDNPSNDFVVVFYTELPWRDHEERGSVPSNGTGSWNFARRRVTDLMRAYKISRADVVSEDDMFVTVRAGAGFEILD